MNYRDVSHSSVRLQYYPSLDTPHDERWESLPNYSATTRMRLEAASGRLRQDDPRAVLNELKYVRLRSSATPQCLRVCYLRGQARMLQEDHSIAAETFAKAQSYLTAAESYLTKAQLSYQLGLALHDQQQFEAASVAHKATLAALNAHQQETGEDEIKLRFECLRRLAGQMLYLYQLEEGLAYLREAKAITEGSYQLEDKTRAQWQGIIEWMMALIYQWKNAPKAAFEHAIQAVEYYHRAEYRAAISRIELVAAECGMDLAARQQADRVVPEVLSDVARLIADARQRIASMRTLLHTENSGAATTEKRAEEGGDVDDKAGAMLGRLADLRYRRLARRGSGEQRLRELYQTIEDAQTMDDKVLIGQANLACADELAALGNSEVASNHYRLAVKYLSAVAPMLAMRARRALERDGRIPSDALLVR